MTTYRTAPWMNALCAMLPSLETIFRCTEPVGAGESKLRAWEKAVAAMPSVLERLLYLAGLRDGESRRYHEGMLEAELGEERADEVMKAAHRQAFLDWLSTDLAAQKACVSAMLNGISTIRRNALLIWGQIEWHQRLFPDNTTEHERLLFLSDMDVVLQLLECEQSAKIAFPALLFRMAPAYACQVS